MKLFFALVLLTSCKFLHANPISNTYPIVGFKAPEIKFSSVLENNLSASDLKNKVVILDFWATWCVPCVKSFPTINSLVNRFKENKDVVFLAITTEQEQIVKQFFEQRNFELDAIKLIDDNRITQENFKVSGLPETFIIDRNGTIAWTGKAEDISEQQIKELLKANYQGQRYNDLSDIGGMSFYTHIAKTDGGYSSYFTNGFWKFDTDGANLKTILNGILSPEVELPIEFLNEEIIKNKNFCVKFMVDTALMNKNAGSIKKPVLKK